MNKFEIVFWRFKCSVLRWTAIYMIHTAGFKKNRYLYDTYCRIVFCGAAMKQYVKENISESSASAISYLVKVKRIFWNYKKNIKLTIYSKAAQFYENLVNTFFYYIKSLFCPFLSLCPFLSPDSRNTYIHSSVLLFFFSFQNHYIFSQHSSRPVSSSLKSTQSLFHILSPKRRCFA